MRLLVSILLAGFVLSAQADTTSPSRPKLVVAILVDQMRSDYLERFHDDFGPGGFRRFTDSGTFITRAKYDYAPTVTGPGHASFFSGATPMMHGIVANDWFDLPRMLELKKEGKLPVEKKNQTMYCCEDRQTRGVGAIDPEAREGKRSPRNFIGSNFADSMRLALHSKVVGISMKDRGAIFPAGKNPAGAFWFESATGNFITSDYYMETLPKWVAEFNKEKRAEACIDKEWKPSLKPERFQYADDVDGEGHIKNEDKLKKPVFPHRIVKGEKEATYEGILATPYGNEILRDLAKAAIKGEGLGQGPHTDLLCVSFSSLDYCGHAFGPYSQEMQDIVHVLDQQLADLFEYIDKEIGLQNVTVLLTADHGVAPTPGFSLSDSQRLGGGILNQISEMGELSGFLNERFPAARPSYLLSMFAFENNIYFDHERLRAHKVPAEAAADAVRDWALGTGRYQAAYSRRQLLEGRAPGPLGARVVNGFNAERSGDVVLVQKPYYIDWGTDGGTTHGSPYAYDTHVPVAFFGVGFKPGRYADHFNITDVVPTLAAALHLNEPPMSIGKPLVRVLAAP